MRSHIFALPATTKNSVKPFIFKRFLARKGLPKAVSTGLGAGGPRFKSGRPDQNMSNQFLTMRNCYFTSNPPVEKPETGGLRL
jgi:hypothetical protein